MMNRVSLRAVGLAVLAAVGVGPGGSLRAATQPLYSNVTTVLNPNIDAIGISNEGLFTVSSFGSIPYRPSNTLNFTNRSSGIFNFDIGLRFETVTNNQQLIASNFVNEGTINVGSSLFSFGSGLFASGGSLVALADNIVHPGTSTAGAGGLLRFQGRTVDMSRATLVASGQVFAGSAGTTNYYNPTGVKDIYWGAGTSHVFRAGSTPRPLSLFNAEFAFRPPFVSSPFHEVDGPSFSVFGSASVPYSFGGNFTAYCWTNRVSASNLVFQVVLVATNQSETNITSAVRFARLGARATAVVELAQPVVDPLTGLTVTNQIYFLDDSIRQSNAVLSANLEDPTYRPRAYEVTRATPFQWFFAEPPNEQMSNITYAPFGVSNLVVSNYYVAYGAEIGNVANSPFAISTGGNQSLTDPALFPGRIELIGGQLDLTMTRAQAENTIIVQTSNLLGQTGAVFDAPVVIYSAASSSGTIALTNFIPSAVRRFNGQIFAYSAVWTNDLGGTRLEYHVLLLDASQLRGNQPVSLPALNIRATNVIVENILNAGQSFVIDSPSLTFNSTNQLFLTSTNVPSLLASNFPSLNFLTNFGIITVASEGRFGSDRVLPLAVMVNGGAISGRTHGIRADSFENTGSIMASAGPLTINTTSAKLEAVTNTGFLSASGNLTINSGNLKIRNHTLTTGAALTIAVTNLLTDNGPGASNQFNTSLGFNLLTRPAVGDLLGTAFASSASANRVVSHSWAGENRGARRAGFSNNAALGRLTLGAGNNSILNFTPVGSTNRHALYVDFLELTGPLLTNLDAFVTVHTNFTIYFAAANRPAETLDGQLGGRLRWVRNFSGPGSSLDVLQRDGRVMQVNSSLRSSLTIDTDNDGIVNGLDEFPFDGVIVQSTITFTNRAYISWLAAAQTGYSVRLAANTNLSLVYAPLVNFTNSAVTNLTATVVDVLPANTFGRDYRVLNGTEVIPRTVTTTNTAYISWPATAQTDYVVEVATNLPPMWGPLLTYTNNAVTNGTAIVADPLPADSTGRFYRVIYSP